MLVEDMMHGHGVRRHGPAWIDQKRAGLAIEPPHLVVASAQVLPADLANVVRAVATRLEIDDADAKLVRLHAVIIDAAALITMAIKRCRFAGSTATKEQCRNLLTGSQLTSDDYALHKRPPLLSPVGRKRLQQHRRLSTVGLPPIHNRLDYVGRQQGKPQHPADVGRVDLLGSG